MRDTLPMAVGRRASRSSARAQPERQPRLAALAAERPREQPPAIAGSRNRRPLSVALQNLDGQAWGDYRASTCRVSSASFLSPSDSNKSMYFMTSPYGMP